MGKILESMVAKVADPEPSVIVETEVVDNPEPEPEVKESELEVAAELAPLQKEIFSRPTETY